MFDFAKAPTHGLLNSRISRIKYNTCTNLNCVMPNFEILVKIWFKTGIDRLKSGVLLVGCWAKATKLPSHKISKNHRAGSSIKSCSPTWWATMSTAFLNTRHIFFFISFSPPLLQNFDIYKHFLNLYIQTVVIWIRNFLLWNAKH